MPFLLQDLPPVLQYGNSSAGERSISELSVEPVGFLLRHLHLLGTIRSCLHVPLLEFATALWKMW